MELNWLNKYKTNKQTNKRRQKRNNWTEKFKKEIKHKRSTKKPTTESIMTCKLAFEKEIPRMTSWALTVRQKEKRKTSALKDNETKQCRTKVQHQQLNQEWSNFTTYRKLHINTLFSAFVAVLCKSLWHLISGYLRTFLLLLGIGVNSNRHRGDTCFGSCFGDGRPSRWRDWIYE